MKKIVLALFLTAAAFSATAQEFIRSYQHVKDSRSVVREVDENAWLTANYYDGNRMGVFFLSDLTSSTYFYDAGWLIVHDLEILNDQFAFYCGERYNYRCYQIGQKDSGFVPEDTLYTIISYDTMGNYVYVKRVRAVMGYFQMDLDNLTLYDFHEVADFRYYLFRCFSKLELLPVVDGIHVLMTGTTKWGNGSLLDATSPTPGNLSWKFYIDTTNDGTIFDDVAVTDNLIVATRRDPSHWYGFIDFHGCPVDITMSTISGYTMTEQLNYSVNDELLLEHCEQDTFATATCALSDSKIMISSFVANNHLATVDLPLFPVLNPLQQLIDIKYDNTLQVLALLQHLLYYGDTSSVIWHLSPRLIQNSGGTISGNMYREENLASIDRQKHNPGYVIASGHPGAYDSWLIYLYQHEIDGQKKCSEIIYTECKYIEYKTNASYLVYPEQYESVEPEIYNANAYYCEIWSICPEPDNINDK